MARKTAASSGIAPAPSSDASAEALAFANAPSTRPSKCPICQDDRARTFVREVLTLMAAGKCSRPLPELHAHVQKHHGYKSALGSFRNHVKVHESELWSKVRGLA